ncbi:MAG TPA: hypothetical protein VMY34_03105, partial [Acidimicrobiales bacterium]|nr:hypothetical protein [Acidimicrobiales bacterium]
MAVSAVAIAASLVLFIGLARMGADLPWSMFRPVTTGLAIAVGLTTFGSPLMAGLLLGPILGA